MSPLPDLTGSENNPSRLLSTRTRRPQGPGRGLGLSTCPAVSAGRVRLSARRGLPRPGQWTPPGPRRTGDPGRASSVPGSRPPPQPAHLAQLLPLETALEGEALVALGAGVERRHVRPGPRSTAPPARPAALSDSLRHNLAAAGCGLRQAVRALGASGTRAGAAELDARSLVHLDVYQGERAGTQSF